LLFAVNAGSDTVSSFRVTRGGLQLVDQEASGGDLPISVDSHNGLLYVLNELSGNIAGLTYNSKGQMTPLAGSRESLSTPGPDGVSTQIAFNPRGTVLTVTQRFQDRIDTFVLGADGTPGPAIANASNAPTPFGFAYDRRGRLISSNAGPRFTFEGSGSSYRLTRSGTLAPIDNEASDAFATCWVVVTRNGKYSFMSNTGSGTVSRFRLANDGGLTLLGTTPTTTPGLAPGDVALSRASGYLYVLSSSLIPDGTANIDAFRVGSDGSLTNIGVTTGLPAGLSGLVAR
jgi:6-phosphogluconolactonase